MAVEVRVEPILPKRKDYPLDVANRVEREVGNVLRGYVQSTLVQAFYRRMIGWKEKPDIRGTFNRRAYKGNLTGFSLTVSPSGRNKRLWVFVSGGTPPHIEPRGGVKLMVIRGGVHGYRPRTMPGDYYGGPGDYDDAGTFRARQINHPGIEARQFEKHIAETNTDDFVNRITAAVARALV